MEQALITRKDPALVQAQEDTDERLHIASFVLSTERRNYAASFL